MYFKSKCSFDPSMLSHCGQNYAKHNIKGWRTAITKMNILFCHFCFLSILSHLISIGLYAYDGEIEDCEDWIVMNSLKLVLQQTFRTSLSGLKIK